MVQCSGPIPVPDASIPSCRRCPAQPASPTITSDGATAWSADVSHTLAVVPDFNGGLVVANFVPGNAGQLQSIVSLNGTTGQPGPAFTPNSPTGVSGVAVHTDGTIFAVLVTQTGTFNGGVITDTSLVGIDPATGGQKFAVSFEGVSGVAFNILNIYANNLIIAGDGYAYVPYSYPVFNTPGPGTEGWHMALLRVNSAGAFDNIPIQDFNTVPPGLQPLFALGLITNAATGVLLTWQEAFIGQPEVVIAPMSQPKPRTSNPPALFGMAITNGTGVSVLSGPNVAGQAGPAISMVQAEDGSFVGAIGVSPDQFGRPTQYNMAAFDQTGNVRWSVPNDQPLIALAGGGVIGQSGITYDQNGSATGQIANLPIYSWTLNAYQDGPIDQVLAKLISIAKSLWPFKGASASRTNPTAVQQPDYAPLKSCPGTSPPCPQEAIMSALGFLRGLLGGNQCTSCTSSVFSKLPGTDQMSFFNYLSRQPRLWDATRSFAPANVALCPHAFTCQFGSVAVRTLFQQDQEPDAMSQTPSDSGKGMQIFFAPSTGICNVLSVANPGNRDQGVLNQAILFHEALHGYTGRIDPSLESAFGLTVQLGESVEITDYLELNVIPGGANGAAVCTN